MCALNVCVGGGGVRRAGKQREKREGEGGREGESGCEKGKERDMSKSLSVQIETKSNFNLRAKQNEVFS